MRKLNVEMVLAILLATAAVSYGHPVPRQATRELIRIQGYRTTDSPAAMKRRLTLVALGSEHSFAATDWQVFGFAEAPPATEPPGTDNPRFALQGDREDLARFASARSEQRVTLLAEHRPGSADLFILALDLCPP
jgi:hypothetical protein